MKNSNPNKAKRRLGQWKTPQSCLGCGLTDALQTAMRPSCQNIHGEEIFYQTEKWYCAACGAEWMSPAQATAGVVTAVEQFLIKHGMLTGSQMRLKRKILNWTQEDLADQSGVSIASIKRAESGVHVLSRLHNDAIDSKLNDSIFKTYPVYEVNLDDMDLPDTECFISNGWLEGNWNQTNPWNNPFEDQDYISTSAADSNKLALSA